MTKTIVIGSKNFDKKIEFFKMLKHGNDDVLLLSNAHMSPHNFEYLKLICLKYFKDADLIFAYNDSCKRNEGILFLGKWNNGIV